MSQSSLILASKEKVTNHSVIWKGFVTEMELDRMFKERNVAGAKEQP
jgi:hypothetical protein